MSNDRPRIVVAAGGCLETSILPYHLIRLKAQFPDLSTRVAVSPNALVFATIAALQGVTGGAVYNEQTYFDPVSQEPLHLALARSDLLVIYPATARIIAQCALGIVECPVTRLFAFTPKDRIVMTPYLHPDMSEELYSGYLQTLMRIGCSAVVPNGSRSMIWGEESAWVRTEAAIEGRLGLVRHVLSGSTRVSRAG